MNKKNKIGLAFVLWAIFNILLISLVPEATTVVEHILRIVFQVAVFFGCILIYQD